MFYLAVVVFPALAILSGLVSLVAAIRYITALQRDIRAQKTA